MVVVVSGAVDVVGVVGVVVEGVVVVVVVVSGAVVVLVSGNRSSIFVGGHITDAALSVGAATQVPSAATSSTVTTPSAFTLLPITAGQANRHALFMWGEPCRPPHR